MKNGNLESMSVDELWELHELVVAELSDKMAVERAGLEDKLRKLSSFAASGDKKRQRYYPPVLPKYRNPKNHRETWAGRGKQPRWVTTQLRSGKKLDDFLIHRTGA